MDLIILPKPSQQLTTYGPFYFRRLEPPLIRSLPGTIKLENTVPLRGLLNSKAKLSILLTRKDSETLIFFILSGKALRNVKRCYIKVGNIEINSKHILKLSGFGKFVFFQESLNTIQLRSFVSLKIIKEISILTIQEALNSINKSYVFSKSSLDVDYISSRDEFILCWGQTISTVDRNEKVTLIYDGESQATKDRFHTISYNEPTSTVLVVSVLSYFLMKYDNSNGNWSIRKLTHPAISRSCRYLDWEPTQRLIFVLQAAGVRNRENILIFSYNEEEDVLKLKASILSVAMSSTNYSANTKKLLYVVEDVIADNRRVMELNLADCFDRKEENECFDDLDEEQVVEGKYLTNAPVKASQNYIFNYFFYNMLVGAPNFNS